MSFNNLLFFNSLMLQYLALISSKNIVFPKTGWRTSLQNCTFIFCPITYM